MEYRETIEEVAIGRCGKREGEAWNLRIKVGKGEKEEECCSHHNRSKGESQIVAAEGNICSGDVGFGL